METGPIHILYNDPKDAFLASIQRFNPNLTKEYLTRGAESLPLISYSPGTEDQKGKDIVSARGGKLITPDIVRKINAICEAVPTYDLQSEPIRVSSVIAIFKNSDQITSLIESNKLSYGSEVISDGENFVVISTKVGNPPRDHILSIGMLPTQKSLCLVLGIVSRMRLEPGSESVDVVNQIHSLLRGKL